MHLDLSNVLQETNYSQKKNRLNYILKYNLSLFHLILEQNIPLRLQKKSSLIHIFEMLGIKDNYN
nr:MAG TPA: hypothetical protein [Caudoviricetes sp.]